MSDLTNATPIDDMPSGDKYIVGEAEGGWGFRCLEAAAVAFDAIMEHPVYATRDEAIAAALAEDVEQVELRRKRAEIERRADA